jgi:hypothetical protein
MVGGVHPHQQGDCYATPSRLIASDTTWEDADGTAGRPIEHAASTTTPETNDSHSGRVSRPVTGPCTSPSDPTRALPTPEGCAEIVRSGPIDTGSPSRLVDTDGKPFGTFGASG